MIFTFIESIDHLPLIRFDSSSDAWECYEMLNACFPAGCDNQFDYFICCASGYENGICWIAK